MEACMRTITSRNGIAANTSAREASVPIRLDTSSLDQYYAQLLKKKRIQGAAYLASVEGEIVLHKAIGKLTFKKGSGPLRPESLMTTMDIAVGLTAAAILQLIERGKLELHQSAASIIPAFDTPYHRGITIHHLLSHRSGLPGNPNVYGEAYNLPHFEWHATLRGDWLSTILSGPLFCKPGEVAAFSYAGYAVLGEIIERVSGMRVEKYIHANLLLPLGMHDSFFDVPPDRTGEIAYAFDWQEGAIFSQADLRMPRSFHGLYASLKDLHRYAQMLLNRGELDGVRVLSEQSVKLLTTNQIPEGCKEMLYGSVGTPRRGLGWRLDSYPNQAMPESTYSMGNSQCGLFVDPDNRVVFAFFIPNVSWDYDAMNTIPATLLWYGLDRGAQQPARTANESAKPLVDAGEKLHARLSEIVEVKKLQGASYAIARAGDIFAQGAAGMRRYNDSHTALTPNDIHMLSSLTKLFTMIAVMKLAGEGQLHLHHAVSKHLPEFDTNLHRGIAIYHLLNHTSGLCPEPGMDGEPHPYGWWEHRFLFEHGDSKKSPWIQALLAGPLRVSPGERVLYSTAGYLVLGELVARASGMSFEQYVQTNILDPLDMKDTFFQVPESRLADVSVADEWQENLLYVPPVASAGEPPRSGAGLYTTMQDLLKLGCMLLNRGLSENGDVILKPRLVELLASQDFMGLPGLHWSDAPRARFPFGEASYPVKQMDFPMPLYHDAALTGCLLLDRVSGSAAVVMMPASVDWSQEPLAEAQAILTAII
jgi:CubicO group peptidase (beta-lactamase class C family)